jgi:hypothetical protein
MDYEIYNLNLEKERRKDLYRFNLKHTIFNHRHNENDLSFIIITDYNFSWKFFFSSKIIISCQISIFPD